MLNNKTYLLICLILFVTFSTNYLLDTSEYDDKTEVMAQNDPDFYMVNPDIVQFDATGKQQHLISADHLNHYPLTDMTTLRTPNLTLYAEKTEQPPWDISAKHGRILPESQLRDQIVELWDDVLAVRTNQNNSFIHIQTKALTVFPDRDYAETDQQVHIDSHTGNTVAGGMMAYFEENKFIFLSSGRQRVHTTLLPQFQPTNQPTK